MDLYERFLDRGWVPAWSLHPPADESFLEMVLIETREHPNMARVLANMSCMFPNAALTIIHSRSNQAFVKDIFGNKPCNIRLICSLPDTLTMAEYSRMLLTTEFWDQITCDKVLMFQMDTGVFTNSILRFLHFDYIGAPWQVDWSESSSSPPCFVGNGGLSLRSRGAMLYACSLPGARTFSGPEDIYFSRRLSESPWFRVASIQEAKRFSVESCMHEAPLGFHKPWESLAEPMIKRLLHIDDARMDPICPPGGGNYLVISGVQIDVPQTHQTHMKIYEATVRRWLQLGIGTRGLSVPYGTVLPLPYIRDLLSIQLHITITGRGEEGLSSTSLVQLGFTWNPAHREYELDSEPHPSDPPSLDPPSPLVTAPPQKKVQETQETQEPQKHEVTHDTPDPVVAPVLEDIVELGYIKIVNGAIRTKIPPKHNIYTESRYLPTITYLEDYLKYHPEFEGEFFLCLYDGWREYSEAVEPAARKYIPWTPDMKRSFIGSGSEGEPRFRHMHKDVSLYPVLPLQILTYNRHEGDKNCLLIPDAEFLTTCFGKFRQQVIASDVPWEKKANRLVWRGSPHLSEACGYQDHGFGRVSVRALAVQYRDIPLQSAAAVKDFFDASFEKRDISWQLQHRFLLDIDGMVSAWSGLYWKLLSNSVCWKLESHWEQWYYKALLPYVHYIPLKSLHQIAYQKRWCDENTEWCKRISAAATELASNMLTRSYAVQQYQIH